MRTAVVARKSWFPTLLTLFEVRQQERVFGAARVGVALSCLAAVRFDPNLTRAHLQSAYLTLALYLIYSVLMFFFFSASRKPVPTLSWCVHAADILFPAVASLFTGGPNSPFLLLLALPLVSAAFRGGLQATFSTALASVFVLLFDALLVTSGWGRRLSLVHDQFHFTAFALQVISVLVVGGALGQFAERERKLRQEALVVKKIVERNDPEADIRQTVNEVLSAVRGLFDAERAVLAMRNPRTAKAFLWTSTQVQPGQDEHGFGEIQPFEMERYFSPLPAQSWYLQRSSGGERCRFLALDREGHCLENVSSSIPASLFSEKPFNAMMGATLAIGREWSVRVFLFGFKNSSGSAADLRYFRELLAEVVPTMHGVYLLQRSRAKVRAVERARVARDLHDGVIQSLIVLEMQVDGLRRQAAVASPEVAEKLESVRRLLREEVIRLRELMQQLQLENAAPHQLGSHLADVLDEFQRKTGIVTSFTQDFDPSAFSPRVAQEVAQIVYEALTNVRKHSGARRVHVHLQSDDGRWKLEIEDDGKGFEFSGRLSPDGLGTNRKAPRVIEQRVRAIEGELAIESHPSQGSRLEIRFAPKGYA